MKEKNEYLFKELYALQKYMNRLQDTIFRIKIFVVFTCKHPQKLDADFRTDVLKYLQTKLI